MGIEWEDERVSGIVRAGPRIDVKQRKGLTFWSVRIMLVITRHKNNWYLIIYILFNCFTIFINCESRAFR